MFGNINYHCKSVHYNDIFVFTCIYTYNLQLPGVSWRGNAYTQSEYDAKINWTAQMLKTIDADVIAFQELWSKQCLIDAFNAANIANEYTLHFIKDSWYDIAVTAAVRKPWEVENKNIHKNFPEHFRLIKREVDHAASPVIDEDDDIEVVIDKFSRSILQLSIKNPKYDDDPNIEVFATHLKSKLPTQLDKEENSKDNIRKHSQALGDALSTIRRVSEAAALRMILTNLLKDTDIPVIALGDFNDSITSNALSIVTSQAAYRLYDASRTGSSSDKGLYSSAIMQNFRSIKDYVYTHEYHGMKDTLDHILFNEQFYSYSRNRLWSFKEMRVWNDNVGDNLKKTSDHGIIKSTFVR